MKPGSARTIIGFSLFLGATAFYAATTGQHSFWLDSAEFVTVARNAGVPHPPGTPLYVLFTTLFTLLPIGAVAFRVHLANAFLGGLCAWLLFELALWAGTVAARPNDEPQLPSWPLLAAAGAIAGAMALSPAIWFQSVRAEVYNLNSVVQLALVHLGVRWVRCPQRKAYPLAAGAVAGLGIANHHFLVVLALLAVLVFLFTDKGARDRILTPWIFWVLVPAAAGLLTYLYLPIRGAHGWRLWGDSGSFSGMWSMLTAEAFHISITEMPRASVPVAMLVIFEKWLELIGFPLAVCGALGLAALLVRSPRSGLLMLALIMAGALSKAIMYLDVENPDDHAYFLIGIQALAASGTGLFHLAHFKRLRGPLLRWTPVAVSVVIMSASGIAGAMNYHSNARSSSLSRFAGGDVLNRHFLGRVPPDAVFMPSYYATFFNHLYYLQVEQRRPDLALVHQSLFSRFDEGKGYALDMTALHPELAPVFQQFSQTGAFPLEALDEVRKRRPVLLETDTLEVTTKDPRMAPFSLGDGGLPIPSARLQFVGPGVLLADESGSKALRFQLQQRFWTAVYEDLEGTPLHPELSKLLVWYHYRNALHFINAGIMAAALLEVRMAQRLSPGEARLLELDELLNTCLEEELFSREKHESCR